MSNDNFHEAITNYNKGILIDPKYAELFYNRGVAYSKIKEFSSALNDFKLAFDLDNNLHQCIGAIIHVKMQIAEFDEIETDEDDGDTPEPKPTEH